MNIGMVLFIIFALIAVISFYLMVNDDLKVKKGKLSFDKSFIKKNLIYIGTFSLSFMLMLCFIYLWNSIKPTGYELFATIVGGLLYPCTLATAVSTFIIHYYARPTDKKMDKTLFTILCVAVPLSLVFFFLTTDGFANYLTYPLVNGLNISHGFVAPNDSNRPNIAFYAICILTGAVFVYLLCDHKFYNEYGKHGILESTFLVAFPAGIVGARIFYVIGNWELEFADGNFMDIINVTNGGLTILGGAITGIVVGVAWFLWRNKGYNIWLGIDIIVPTILLAQGIGRWGNFFNCEVHGGLVSETYFKWLPRVVFNNIHYSDAHGLSPEGYVYAPLFLIEGIFNFLGYFVLAHLFGNRLRKYVELGDVAFGYLIWYGTVRAFMEPLRDGAFNMGTDGYWSWFWSISFALIGMILIASNHLVRYFYRKHNDVLHVKNYYKFGGTVSTIVIVTVGLVLVIVGSYLMLTNPMTKTIGFTGFNNGLITLLYGVATLFGLGVSLPIMIEGFKKGQTNE